MNAHKVQDGIVGSGVHYDSSVVAVPYKQVSLGLSKWLRNWIFKCQFSWHEETKCTLATSEWLVSITSNDCSRHRVDSVSSNDKITFDFSSIFESYGSRDWVNIHNFARSFELD